LALSRKTDPPDMWYFHVILETIYISCIHPGIGGRLCGRPGFNTDLIRPDAEKSSMSRFAAPAKNIEKLVANSFRAINEGAYEHEGDDLAHKAVSLERAILSSKHAALITEVKFSSPSSGNIRSAKTEPTLVAGQMTRAGACALSVLTQPHLFDGSVANLAKVRRPVSVPLIMKHIIVSRVQVDAGLRAGADCVLLIKSVFDRGLAEEDLDFLINYIKKHELQVLLEAHTSEEYVDLIKQNHRIVGINNRNLDDLSIDLSNTERLIAAHGKGKSIVVAESGIASAKDIRRLHQAGADAFLIGTSIMASNDIEAKVSELHNAL